MPYIFPLDNPINNVDNVADTLLAREVTPWKNVIIRIL